MVGLRQAFLCFVPEVGGVSRTVRRTGQVVGQGTDLEHLQTGPAALCPRNLETVDRPATGWSKSTGNASSRSAR
ncbi:hypothetical protein GCM10010478_35650 [Streptomyces erythrogriseus]|uniref:Uncharacterized protein n=1 Tax=Streptomyces erythrogriseus TaxID=284027 RepID=A0ABP6JHY0_9ACTN